MALYIFIVLSGLFMIFNGILTNRINVTNVYNCDINGLILPVELFNISYIQNDTFVDTIHGYYEIKNNDPSSRDVILKMYKCASKSNDACSENVEERIYSFTCEHYLKDIGPWSLLADSMSGNHCTHPLGIFELKHSKFDPIFFEGYVKMEPKYKHYRLFLEFKSRRDATVFQNSSYEDLQTIRACINVEFDVYFE